MVKYSTPVDYVEIVRQVKLSLRPIYRALDSASSDHDLDNLFLRGVMNDCASSLVSISANLGTILSFEHLQRKDFDFSSDSQFKIDKCDCVDE